MVWCLIYLYYNSLLPTIKLKCFKRTGRGHPFPSLPFSKVYKRKMETGKHNLSPGAIKTALLRAYQALESNFFVASKHGLTLQNKKELVRWPGYLNIDGFRNVPYFSSHGWPIRSTMKPTCTEWLMLWSRPYEKIKHAHNNIEIYKVWLLVLQRVFCVLFNFTKSINTLTLPFFSVE